MAERLTWGGKRVLSYDNGRSETWYALFVEHENGPWDAIFCRTEEHARSLLTLSEQHEKMLDVLLNSQGCRTCDMCPDCGHLAHGAAKDIGHYDACEIAEVLAQCRPRD